MSKFSLDLNKFRKIEESNKHSVLEHSNGHKITIAKHSISPELRKQLEDLPMNMAKGGPIKGAKASKPSASSNTMPGSPTMAKDNFTEPDAMGTDIPKANLQKELHDKHYPDVVIGALDKKAPPFGPLGASPKQHYPPCINPSCKSYGKSHPNCRCYGGHSGTKGEHENMFFAEGGEVKGIHKSSMDVERPSNKTEKQFAGESKAGEHVRNMDINPGKRQKALDEHHRALGEMVSMKKPNLKGMAEGGEVDGYCSDDRPHHPDCEYFKEGGIAEGDVAGEAPADIPAENQQPDMAVNLNTQDVNPNPEVQGSDNMPAQQPTHPDQPEQPVQEQQTPQAPIDQFQQHKQNAMNDIYPEAQAFAADMDNGHIKPETYHDLFAKKDTLGKIGTLFGLLIGGAGAGLSHQPNMLMGMMDNEIKRDLEAQQSSVQNKQSFLKINQQNVLNQAQAKNITADAQTKAYALSRMQMNYAALHKLVTDTQKLPEGPQKQQAMQTLAMMSNGIQNENYNIADRAASSAALAKTLFGGQGNQPNTTMMKTGLLGPEAKEMGADVESKTMPGVPGKSNIPLSSGDREEINSGVEFDKQLNNYIKWAKGHSGDLSPSDIKYGKSLAAGVQGAYRQATHGGVYKEGEQNFISKIINDDPTAFFNKIRVLPSVQAVSDQHQIRMDQLMKSKGFPGYQRTPSQQSNEPQQMTSKSGRPMVQKDGKWIYK